MGKEERECIEVGVQEQRQPDLETVNHLKASKEPPTNTKTPPSFPANLMTLLMLRKGVFPCDSCLSHLASEPLRRASENILEVKLNCEGEAVPVSIPLLAWKPLWGDNGIEDCILHSGYLKNLSIHHHHLPQIISIYYLWCA